MDDRQQGVKVLDEAPVGPSRKRTRTVLIGVVALLGALMVVENAGAATPRRRSAVSRVTFGQGSRPQVPPAVKSPAPAGTSQASVLAQAQGHANSALARTRPFGSGTAEQHISPNISSIACPIILSAAQRVAAQIDGLIAAFPFLAPQLSAIKASVLAQLNAQLSAFHCGVSVG